ncbi:DUF805 domain-containing protein [Streptomyces sp. NPDC090022]|uniref:DUF805 domain-containing protein n=1 Tax=Streptomyces sp. NPDC090022 TaxID=3365920 RepID=UPI003803101E
MKHYIDVLRKYALFGGRARRQEYWLFALFSGIIEIALLVLGRLTGVGLIPMAVYLAVVFLPGLGVTLRRLHDTDRSGWWALIGLIPVIGWIVILVFMADEGRTEPNKWGPNPKYAGAA